ncbi:MAG: tocopherol cyclase family protein [Anaerocolumna sp.]
MNNLINKMRRKCFFEGWYFKQQAGNRIICFIPGINTDSNGNSHAFIQIIMKDNSYAIPFPINDFRIDRGKMIIRIGNNIFSRRGIQVDINTTEINIKGILQYGKTVPLRYTIMGYFKYFPWMECKHEIISMEHKVKGTLICNGIKFTFHKGTGYIEKDMGYSFPKSYLWIQCNHFLGERCSIFVSVADIPYHGIFFKGCICAIVYKGKEYRLATYLGVKILKSSKSGLCLKQGNYLFKIHINESGSTRFRVADTKRSQEFSQKLFAPVMGDMSRTIKEQHLTTARFLLYHKRELIFDLASREVSFEYEE